MTPLLELESISRSFVGVSALSNVDFRLLPGEVHALVGENGAGKSTLINLISGVFRPDSGTIRILGDSVALSSPAEARDHGVSVVHQEPDVFEHLTIAESMALQRGIPIRSAGWVDWTTVGMLAQSAVERTGLTIDISEPAGSLSVASRQMLQIAIAVTSQARILLLDEPTSSLSQSEAEWLFRQISELRERGSGIVYISHRLEEVARIADRITVLRDGHVVWNGAKSAISPTELIRAMVGRDTSQSNRSQNRVASARTCLETRSLTAANGQFRDVSLTVDAGEILGIYGLVGAGRSKWGQALFGLYPIESGSVLIDGQPYVANTPADAVGQGLVYLPEDRLKQGIFPGLSIRHNLTISSLKQFVMWLFISKQSEQRACDTNRKQLGLKARSTEQPIRQLSGGNQQKVVFGRWLLPEPKVLILDEPTRGVDVAAKSEIHALIRETACRGSAIVLISSELPEVLSVADRIVVFRDGVVSFVGSASAVTSEQIAIAALPIATSTTRVRATNGQASIVDRWKGNRAIHMMGRMSLVLAIAALMIVLTFTTNQRFATWNNLAGVLEKSTVIGVMALGVSSVMIAGGIDISIGSLLALSAACGGLTMQKMGPGFGSAIVGSLVALLVGTAGGLVNAYAALLGRIHPVVVTLGMISIYRGLLLAISKGNVIGDLPASFRSVLTGRLVGLQGAGFVLIACGVAIGVWQTRFRTGRHGFAFGSNPRAARLAGISQSRTWLIAFALCGLCAAGGGLIELAQNGSMQSSMGQGYELKAIAATVIGGTAVTGGRGSAFGTLLGAVLLALVQNGLVLWGVSAYRYDLVTGGLLAFAVIMELGLRRKRHGE